MYLLFCWTGLTDSLLFPSVAISSPHFTLLFPRPTMFLFYSLKRLGFFLSSLPFVSWDKKATDACFLLLSLGGLYLLLLLLLHPCLSLSTSSSDPVLPLLVRSSPVPSACLIADFLSRARPPLPLPCIPPPLFPLCTHSPAAFPVGHLFSIVCPLEQYGGIHTLALVVQDKTIQVWRTYASWEGMSQKSFTPICRVVTSAGVIHVFQ